MILYIDNHEFLYETEALCRVFFPLEKIKIFKGGLKSLDDDNEDIVIYTGITGKAPICLNIAVNYLGNKVQKTFKIKNNANISILNKEIELKLAKELFYILSAITKITPQ